MSAVQVNNSKGGPLTKVKSGLTVAEVLKRIRFFGFLEDKDGFACGDDDIVVAESAPYVFKKEGNAEQEQTNTPQESTLLQQLKQMMLSDASAQPPPPTVACRLWVGDRTVYKLPAPSFAAFHTAVRSVFEFEDCDNISYYYIADKSAVHSRKYISNDHDLEKFHFLAGKPTIFVWQRGDPSLSPDSLPSEIEIKAMSAESLSESSGSTRGHAQKLFRSGVLARDNKKCVLSGTVLREKTNNVQAAHIFGVERALAQERERVGIYNPYDTQNGMLLETSLHADFDSYLWCMDEFLIVHVGEKGIEKGLSKWDGKKLNIKFGEYGSPTPGVLKARYALFLRKQNPNPPRRKGQQSV